MGLSLHAAHSPSYSKGALGWVTRRFMPRGREQADACTPGSSQVETSGDLLDRKRRLSTQACGYFQFGRVVLAA
jgi:hypothetical protein